MKRHPSPKRSEAEVARQLAFEALVSDLSVRFVNLPPGEVDREILEAERRICHLLGLDIAALWQWSEAAPGCFTLTHYYSATEGPQPPERMNSREFFPWIQGQVLAGRSVAFCSLDELPAEAAHDREVDRQLGIKSNLTIPLSVGGERPVGALGLCTTRWERDWPDALVKRLQLLAQIFANALARKRANEALRESESQWQATFDSISDPVMILDPHQRILKVNAATLRFFGLPREKITGGFCYQLMHGTPGPMDGCPCQTTFQTGGSAQSEVFHPGSGKWLLFSTDPIRDAAGNLLGAVHVAKNITQRRQAEAELLRQRAELAHLARVAMLGELSGSIAHELNQPLTAILSNAQAAQRFLADDHADRNEVREILADIVAEDKRAGEIIRRLRLLFKKGEVQPKPLSVNELVLEVLKLLRSDVIGHNVTVKTELAPGLPAVHADAVQLQQVLLNLIMNACEVMGEIDTEIRQLTIRTRRFENGSVHVSIKDSGPGIASEKLEQIFDSFYTTKPQGLGLGLAVCRSIIGAHKGELWATNNPERGATLHFTLPALITGY